MVQILRSAFSYKIKEVCMSVLVCVTCKADAAGCIQNCLACLWPISRWVLQSDTRWKPMTHLAALMELAVFHPFSAKCSFCKYITCYQMEKVAVCMKIKTGRNTVSLNRKYNCSKRSHSRQMCPKFKHPTIYLYTNTHCMLC